MKRVHLQVLMNWAVLPAVLLGAGVCSRTLAAPETPLAGQVRKRVERVLKVHHLPGAQVSLVKDGKVLLAEGYGLADVESRRPVTADTPFRVGSVSKVFTWTALMQLVEQGKVDLGEDVNVYLKAVQVPSGIAQPVTVWNLMTHTAGFDERELGGKVVARKKADILPFSEALKIALPSRVKEPGVLPAYCNYCAALAGGIIEQQSGLVFEQYLQQKVLEPLGMQHSSFTQNLPPEIAQGYVWEDGHFEPVQDHPLQLPPEGSLYSTPGDMARFMLFQLGAKAPVLQRNTVLQMQQVQYRFDPRLPGIGLGWFEGQLQGFRTVWHAGNVDGFGSWLTLVPSERVGIYVALNGKSDEHARMLITSDLLKLLLPEGKPTMTGTTQTRVPDLDGFFRSTRRSDTTAQKIEQYLTPEVTFSKIKGTLTLQGSGRGFQDGDGSFRHWTSAGAHLLTDERRETLLAYRTDAKGRVTAFQISTFPFIVYEKIPWWDRSSVQLKVLLTGLAMMLVSGTLSFLVHVVRWRRMVALLAALHLLVLVCTVGWLLTGGMSYSISPLFLGAGAASVLILPVTLLLAWGTVRNRGKDRWILGAMVVGSALASVFWTCSRVLGWQV